MRLHWIQILRTKLSALTGPLGVWKHGEAPTVSRHAYGLQPAVRKRGASVDFWLSGTLCGASRVSTRHYSTERATYQFPQPAPRGRFALPSTFAAGGRLAQALAAYEHCLKQVPAHRGPRGSSHAGVGLGVR